jgi:DNA topoisomerase-2
MKIKDFLNNELVDFASYSTLRAIASLIDGQKNASRKVIHTVQKKNITKKMKVEVLSGTVAVDTEYLHGPQNLNDVITGLAKNFIGANNIEILFPAGGFGTRHEPMASAPRYINTYKTDNFDKLFNKYDNGVLIQQEFEGTIIEPRFLMPTLPLLAVNGSEGIATGFAQKILPRNIDDIKKFITAYLEGTELPEMKPFYRGFKGDIEQSDEHNKWKIKGKIEKGTATRFKIYELPIGYTLDAYIKVLNDLEEKKIIKNYIDKSLDDKFEFHITADMKFLKMDEDKILDKMKLIKSVSENYTCIDENNRVVVYNNISDVVKHYIKVKLEYTQKRKDYQLQSMKNEMLFDASKYVFCKSITDDVIVIHKKTEAEIIAQLDGVDKIIKQNDSYDYLLDLKIKNITDKYIARLKEKIMTSKDGYKELMIKPINDIWKDEIDLIKS